MKTLTTHLLPLPLLALALLSLTPGTQAATVYENYTITTIAGPGQSGAGSEDGQALASRFNQPAGMALDAAGNLYVADSTNHTIRKITVNGFVETLAGVAGLTGTNDGIGCGARFNTPDGIAADSSGNLYVADTSNHSIRKITPSGVVTTVAGLPGVAGTNNGVGTAARFNSPNGLAVDGTGDVYVADSGNHAIRKIAPDGTVSTLAGRIGTSGTNNGAGSSAQFYHPGNIAVAPNGTLYVADTGNCLIRVVSPAGDVSTLAGQPEITGSADGSGATAQFYYPWSITLDTNANMLYVVDSYNHTVRQVTLSGNVTTLAGTAGSSGTADGTGNAARFNYPFGITADSKGTIYVGDTFNYTIRKISSAAVVTTIAGKRDSAGSTDGPADQAHFSYSGGVAVDTNGNVYVADFGNHTIRKINPQGTVITFAGSAGMSGTNDGLGTAAHFNTPSGVAMGVDGNVYVADTDNHTVRKIASDGTVTTLAGTAGASGTNDGVGIQARFNTPNSLVVDANTNVYVADSWNHSIRRITPGGAVSTLAGRPGTSGTNDGAGSTARFAYPQSISIDNLGNLWVADTGNDTIRQVTASGVVTTVAGTAGAAGSTDGTNQTARFHTPWGIAVDLRNNNVFVADTYNYTLREISSSGVVTTLAGLAGLYGNNDGTGSVARFGGPEGLAVDGMGNIYVADAGNHTIRKGFPASTDIPVVDLTTTNVLDVTRHLSVLNSTTTNWTWSFIRYPANSSAQLSSTNTSATTLTPDVYDFYTVRFEGQDSQGRTAIGTVSFGTDDTSPTVVITNPMAGQGVSQLTYTVSGTASDDQNLASVWYQINGSAWAQANGTTNWSATVTLTSGNNELGAYAVDTMGNVSTTNTVSFVFATEKIPPTLTITAPKANLKVSSGSYTVTGKASDKGGVASVWVKLNDGDWAQATGTTNWSSSLSLPPGTNTLWAYAKDNSANCSKTNSVKFIYSLSAPLTLETTGQGTLAPNYSNAPLLINLRYTITATPAKNGYLFSNWTDNVHGVLTNGTKLSFFMASNLVLTANFVTNPFIATKGTYSGLFMPTNASAAAHTNSGKFTATLTTSGKFSAKLLLGGLSYSLSPTFPVSGIYTTNIPRKGLSPLAVQLVLNTTGSNIITGTISSDDWQSSLHADLAVYSKANPVPAQWANKKFTMVIDGTNAPADGPGNYGAMSLTISAAGTVSFAGVLSDGSKATLSAPFSQYHQCPFYLALYSSKGSTRGWLNFTNADFSPSGALGWSKSDNTAKVYKSFNLTATNADLQVLGSPYTFTAGTSVLNLTNGIVQLQDGNLSAAVVTGVTLGTNNKLTPLDKKVTLTLTTASGLFSGKVPVVLGGKATTVSINGAVLQNQNAGFGGFLGTSESGSVTLENLAP